MNETIEWALNTLHANNYFVIDRNPEVIQDKPWSQVYRIDTDRGSIFLKKVPAPLALESSIIHYLSEKFNAPVPQIVASNPGLYCFLMQDAGIQLHEYFKEKFDADILIQALQSYSTLEIATHTSIEHLITLGVPDWRLEKLPMLYLDLIVHEKLLLEDGLYKRELIQLKNLANKFSSICEKLSFYNIKDTFGHADFHDKNILIQPKTKLTTIIDLGEVVITHPFFSLLNCIHRASQNFSLSEETYRKILIACFKPWQAFESEDHLFEILTLIHQCWSIHSVLGELRLINSVVQADYQKLRREGRLANNLRHWINQG